MKVRATTWRERRKELPLTCKTMAAQVGVALPYFFQLFLNATICNDLDKVITGVGFADVLNKHVAKIRGGSTAADEHVTELAGETLLRVISYCMGYDMLGKPIAPHNYLISGAAERAHVDWLRLAALAWVKLKAGRADATSRAGQVTIKAVVCEALKETSLNKLRLNTAKLNELRSRIRHQTTLFDQAIRALGHLDSVSTADSYRKRVRERARKYLLSDKRQKAGVGYMRIKWAKQSCA